MGASTSYNDTNVVINAVAKIATNISQNVRLSTDSSQMIYISDVKGDVIIRGNKMIQKATINMQALFNAMSSATAQQDLAIEIAQSAKSLTSGLNLGQFSSATNDVSVLVNTAIDLTTNIAQTCSAESKQTQQITVEHTIGDVIIENNLFEQVADIIQNCVSTSTANSAAFQKIATNISQTASATSAGISPWFLVGLLAVVIGFPTMGVAVIGKSIFKYLFPIVAIVGVVFIVVYFYTKKSSMVSKAYSTFISTTPSCVAEGASKNTSYETFEAAEKHCNEDSNCAAFDWHSLNIDTAGSWTIQKPPETTFYTHVESVCRDNIKQDNANTLRNPSVFFGASAQPPPNISALAKGDCWIDTTTSNWYQLIDNWEPRDKIVQNSFTKLAVLNKPPDQNYSGIKGDVVIVYIVSTPAVFSVYIKNDKEWVKDDPDRKGPGPYSQPPLKINGSGFKDKTEKTWMLYGGIAALGLGIVGTVASAFMSSKEQTLGSESNSSLEPARNEE